MVGQMLMLMVMMKKGTAICNGMSRGEMNVDGDGDGEGEG